MCEKKETKRITTFGTSKATKSRKAKAKSEKKKYKRGPLPQKVV